MKNEKETGYLELIKQFIGEIKYGNISIIIQDGKVIQVEKNEKYRIKN